MNSPTHSKNPTILPLLMSLVLACFGLAPLAQAVGPDTDGNIPGANNGEGVGVLVSRTTGIWNTGTGFEALNHLTAGNQNTATGLRALFSDINGGFNTATGVYSLFSNTTGFFNSATGAYALSHNTDGNQNTANGYSALYFNSEGDNNTAIGFAALYKNTTGNFNTATGWNALNANTTGGANTAIGRRALFSNTTGSNNIGVGSQALLSNTTGSTNTAVGEQTMFLNTIGAGNAAFGDGALHENTTGNANTAIGEAALGHNTTGSSNIALGVTAGTNLTTGNFNIDIGNTGVAGESSTIRIGNELQTRTFISAIRGVTTGVADAVNVLVDSNGQLGTLSSSRRFKKEIKPMDHTSEVILALKPVTFHYKSDASGTPQFGLIAEEVAAVNPDLVVRDDNGEIYSVRYDAVNAMLLNEFLKAHRKAQQQEATIAQLKQDFTEQRKQIDVLTAGLQKVSAELELNKAAPQTVLNNQ